jgi:hypothetical protein
MSASNTSVGQLVGDLRHIGLGVGHQQVLRLRAVNGVAETPAADRLVAGAVAALRVLAAQAGAALAARSNRADQHAITDRVAGDAGAELADHPHRLVSDDQAAAHRVLAAQDVQIGAADGRQGDSYDRLTRTGGGPWNLLDTDVVDAVEDVGLHRRLRRLGPPGPLFGGRQGGAGMTHMGSPPSRRG